MDILKHKVHNSYFRPLVTLIQRWGGEGVQLRGGSTVRGFVGIQWTPSNPATLGTSQSVLIRGVASFSGVD